MAQEPESPPLYEESQKLGWRLPLLVAAMLGLGVLGAIVWLGRPTSHLSTPPVPTRLPPLDPEAEAYLENVTITDLGLSRWKNMIGQEVIYLDGTVGNQGERTILALELTVEFQDQLGAVVLREVLRPVGSPPEMPASRRAPSLPPGQSRSFRVGFEHIPVDWNRFPPNVRITGLLLQ